MVQTSLKKYFIKKQIGHGTFGKVYKAINLRNKKKVAIKEVWNANKAKKEASIMKKYGKSKFLPKIYDFFVLNSTGYVVMEYIRGVPLGNGYEYIEKKRKEKLSIQITINILKGLKHLHNIGYAHYDLHPKNIMLNNKIPKRIKIIDFNLAKKINAELIHKDLYSVSKICVYLINGTSPKNLKDVEISNKKLESVLKNVKYKSAQEFINALKPFR